MQQVGHGLEFDNNWHGALDLYIDDACVTFRRLTTQFSGGTPALQHAGAQQWE
jgi:hypothetical protein